MLALLAVSAVVGLLRGLSFELLSLAGWFVAWFASLWLGPPLAPLLPFGGGSSLLSRGVAYAAVFLLALVVCSLIARAVAAFIAATPLRPIDRLLGAGFGLLRGLVILLAVATVVTFTPLGRSEAWHGSLGATWLNAALRNVIGSFFPGRAPPAVGETAA
ncbi:MAG: CvpA family protein [Pseudomonadota bacterium]|nr:CvpA family protein [Pseudomonadota bacterium]